MHCANPNCRAMADELLKGTLTLVEFESSPDDRVLFSAGGFPVYSARTRYFWLCQTCSHMFTIRGWNRSGLILRPLPDNDARSTSPAARKFVSREASDISDPPERFLGAA
jgi:hypothetical protein